MGLLKLFTTYTSDADSIGAHLTDAVARRDRDHPLIAATSADVVLYPGNGHPPQVEGFRLATKGFKELAAVSHLGPAVASLVNLKALNEDWRPDAGRLLTIVDDARLAGWPELEVNAYRGHDIAAMVDYACAVTSRYLRTALSKDDYLGAESLREHYLEGAPVPFDRVMVATFFLVGMDIAHRLMTWFATQDIDWETAMAVIAGQQGRPTAGVTWNTSSVAMIISGASGGRLPMDRMYLAPHAPTFPPGASLHQVAALEKPLRRIWYSTHATVELGPTMFDGYPRFRATPDHAPDVSDPAITEVSCMPTIASPQDMRALVTRMRVVLEDPRQLLSSCVTDYAVAALTASGNDPSQVDVPGLTGILYPVLPC